MQRIALQASLLALLSAQAQGATLDADGAPETITLPESVPSTDSRPLPVALEEIVVTAQRRAESQQDTPVSVLAFDAEDLDAKGIDGLNDMGAYAPGFQAQVFSTSNANLQLYVRGIGIIDSQITQDPAVGVYVDGVYVARSAGLAIDIADLERVEVLRGPQGTLYGRNTIGGSVNLVTRKPDFEGLSIRQRVESGNRNTWLSQTVVNVPVTDWLAVKGSLKATREDGYVENTGPGGDFGDRSFLGGTFDLRALLTDRMTVDYRFEHSDLGYHNYLFQAVLQPDSNKGEAQLIKGAAAANSVFSDTMLESMATGAPLEESQLTVTGHALTAEYQFDGATLSYIGAYRELDDAFYIDFGGGAGSTDYRLDPHSYTGPAARVHTGDDTVPLNLPKTLQDQVSHELKLAGEWRDRLNYVVGLYYFEETGVEDYMPVTHMLSAPLNPLSGVLDGLGLLDLIPNGVEPKLVSFVSTLNESDNKAWAGFGQVEWITPWFDDRLTLGAGYRYSRDERWARKFSQSAEYVEVTLAGLAVPFPSAGDTFDGIEASKAYGNDSWSALAKWAFTTELMGYAKWSQGYKSGGFNLRDPQIDGQSAASDGQTYGYGFVTGFRPETVDAYELGLKSESFGRRLRINAAIFDMRYDDMQFNFIVGGTVSDTKTTNAGRARIQGFELDVVALPLSNLRLSLGYAYLDAQMESVSDGFGNDVTADFQFNAAPRHTGAAQLDIGLARQHWGALDLVIGFQYRDATNGGAKVGAPLSLQGYGLLDAALSLYDLPPLWGLESRLTLWGRNLLDKRYEISAIDNLPHSDRAVIWGEPLTFGASLSLTWQ